MNTDTQASRIRLAALFALLALTLVAAVVASADVPNRVGVRGTVPLPGTQEQELTNITFPAPYNVFEFLVTCGACHGGTVDQQAGHFGNWSGSAMASAARDPVFRANQIIVNSAVTGAIGQDGAGNMCFRCHSPNGWYSGRFDPQLNGATDGSTMLHSIVLSTDDEGIPCEMCHRTLGSVTYKRADLDPNDPVWNMMAGIADWPHNGGPYVDQDGDPTLAEGNPYGDTTLQIDDGMTYGGRYPGYVLPYWDDTPLIPDPQGYMGYSPGGPYTGQTYGTYPPGWLDPQGNPVGGLPAYNADGTLPIHLDVPVGPPLNPDGTPCYQCQAVSLEHPTFGASFVEEPELCGSCHDLTIPMLNQGMPEQRTYSEWKYSALGDDTSADYRTCQSCHMPRLSHEYSDSAPVTLNVDPVVSGWFPYAKSRTNTAFHKFAGANRDLPAMMKALYPEIDFEVIGGVQGAFGTWVGTGYDPRIFPGMLSNRDPMFDRNQRNTEISLQDGVDVQIASGPTWNAATNKWDVQVKVINNSGHRVPSGYPDGRRMWIHLRATDGAGALLYESGYYDQATARLYTDAAVTSLTLALDPVIIDDANAVMVYQRITGRCAVDGSGNLTSCTPSQSLLNDTILFDNRIPPYGFDYAAYRTAGVKFWNLDPATYIPFEDTDRYVTPSNWDLVTYSFSGTPDVVPNVRAEVLYQSHTRAFMEYLRVSDKSTVRPEGQPRPWDPNYPLAPNYLAVEFGLADWVAQMVADGWLAPGQTLNDNWGGIAYASWYATGKGAPFLAAVVDTADLAVPPAPTLVRVTPECDPVTGACVGGRINPDTGVLEAYTQIITWTPVPEADGYLVWIKYGPGATTASWDRLASVPAGTTEVINTAINVAKTYLYKVQAFNGAGYGPESAIVTARTPWDLPLPPENLVFVSATSTTITMSWYDGSDNETGWIVYRQDSGALGGFAKIASFPTPNGPGFGGVTFTDGDLANPDVTWEPGYTPPVPGMCYNYVVEAFNSAGTSGWNINGPVMMCTTGTPGAPGNLVAAAISGRRVDLGWAPGVGTITGFRIERSTDGGVTWAVVADLPNPAAVTYSDGTVAPQTTYWYRVFAYNTLGDSPPSAVVQVTTPALPPAPPGNLRTTLVGARQVDLAWNDRSLLEDGFAVERGSGQGPGVVYAEIGRVAQNVTTFSDVTVLPKLTYSYRVRAFNAGGPSPYSNVIVVVTPGEPPQAPSDLRLVLRGFTSLTIGWTDNSANELGFYIERSLDGVTYTRVGQVGINVTTYMNSGLTRGTLYYYRVQAVNADGVSAYTAPLMAMTR